MDPPHQHSLIEKSSGVYVSSNFGIPLSLKSLDNESVVRFHLTVKLSRDWFLLAECASDVQFHFIDLNLSASHSMTEGL